VSNPASARVRSEYSNQVELEDRVLKWTGVLDFSSDAENFYYDYTRILERNGEVIREKNWNEVIPRDFN